jgi:Amidase
MRGGYQRLLAVSGVASFVLTRREILKAGSTTAVTAILSPLWGNTGSEKESSNMRRTELAKAPSEEICFTEATELVELLRTKRISAVEVMKAHLSQIARVSEKVNAIVTLVDEEQLLAEAQSADNALAKGNWRGPLHELPIGVKTISPG